MGCASCGRCRDRGSRIPELAHHVRDSGRHPDQTSFRESRDLGTVAEELRALGRTLYDRVGTLTGHLQTMRPGLERAVTGYNKCVGSLDARVLPAARRFVDLGVSVDREIPHLETVDELPRKPRAEVTA
ncbi:MAG: DNA recombination protein RmuC, partial [Planctomycetes bacterium]|nr:DNA recombination protein RmuC [Planctomycetota bacterium]